MTHQPSLVPAVENIDEQRLIEMFVADCKLRNLSLETIRRYRGDIVTISSFLNLRGLNLPELDKYVLKEVLAYLVEKRRVSPKTIGNYFAALSSFYQFLMYENLADRKPILPFRKRYLRQYKNAKGNSSFERKLISVSEMAMLINSILNPRDKAIITLLAKTGIRKGELISIDLTDIDWIEQSIQLKPHPKRSNCTVFFDDECARVLSRWLKARENYTVKPGCKALFVGEQGMRLKRNGVYRAVTIHAERVGLHDPKSNRTKDHFSPHCCRHWFTTHLRRNNMRREFIKELRGDARNEAMDIYDHIDKKELKRAYLAAIPVLGIG